MAFDLGAQLGAVGTMGHLLVSEDFSRSRFSLCWTQCVMLAISFLLS